MPHQQFCYFPKYVQRYILSSSKISHPYPYSSPGRRMPAMFIFNLCYAIRQSYKSLLASKSASDYTIV